MLRATAKFLGAAFIGVCLIWSAYNAFAQAPQYDEDGTPYQTRPMKICGADPNDDVSAPGYTCACLSAPPDFDPYSATAEELEKYCYPPKPNDPEGLENWNEMVAPLPAGVLPHHSPVQLMPDQTPP
jgi:hypothetical protein